MAVVELPSTEETDGPGPAAADPLGQHHGLGSCTDDALSYSFTQLEVLRRTLLARQLAVVAEVDRRASYKTDGANNLADWVFAPTGMAPGDARAIAHLAASLDNHPHLGAAIDAGAFNLDQAALVLRFLELTDTDEAAVVDDAQGRSVTQLRAAVGLARTIPRHETTEAHRRRSVTVRYDEAAGCYRINGRLTNDGGAVVKACLERLADTANPGTANPGTANPGTDCPDDDVELRDPFDSKVADALVELCSTEIDADADADRATVVIHAPAQALGGHGSAIIADTDAPIAPDTLRRVLCDARLDLVGEGPGGTDPYRLGRTTRTIPAPLSRHLRWRDRTCRFPGCARRRRVQGHHIRHWADGGATNDDNLVLLCSHHHHLIHEGDWNLTGNPNRTLTFTNPHGTTYTSLTSQLSEQRRPTPGTAPPSSS
ncbi:MAG: HNH endonuclease [Actinomycetota bacterium]|nr:HNH endonuclease [Actinomycetota bacterium]